MTFAPHQPSPLSRTPSLFKDPRTPPTTPGKTAKIWDEYEKQAVENARRREGQSRGSQPQRASASDIPRSSATVIASARSSFDFKFKSRLSASSSSTVAICKSCKQPITYASGICELCKKSVVLSPSGEATPPLSPLSRKLPSGITNISANDTTIHIAFPRLNSATPSELSSLYPHTSRITSVGTGYGLQHATSAWDDWDSDGEGEKAGLVGLMKSIGKTKKKERGDSMESASASLHSAREEERKKSRDTARHSEESEVKEVKKKKRPSGFVRAISCGACRED
ncbi:hypothetical protein SNOG_00221 [Parastagonospora nodorum SN15]|uniref:Uncharacterized protein n=1 Tax=Phaeosphaeria nodorum (strain SN15 / ATCC MYA-4574 / FGSC 10173) TaxID=321614 RepID=Q0V6Z3_PHANO|nr:hypothetical protein SNOG_00221 [Parastagonospora nodorum SN15]EAT91716.2 hypothetical protein SNOG_00221 [Parastagonospora nodorum SN15]